MTMALLVVGSLLAGAGLIGALAEFAKAFGVWTSPPGFRSDDREAAQARMEEIRRDPSIRRLRLWTGPALVVGVVLMSAAMALQIGVERGTGTLASLWPIAGGAVLGLAIGFAGRAALRRSLRLRATR